MVFTAITHSTDISANSCWLETTIDTDRIVSRKEVQAVEIVDGGVYRIKGLLRNGNHRTIYTNGAKKKLCWTGEEQNDASTLFVVKQDEKDESKFYLISALANGVWEQDGTLTENGIALTISSGWHDNTYMIMGDANRRFAVPGTEATGEVNYYSNCTEAADAFVTDENSTDFVFEKVEDELVNFNVSFKKGQKYATMYLPFAVSAQNDVTAYYSTLENIDKENKVISLESFENVIPARTAVVLYREDATTAAVNTFTYTTDQADALSSDNIFKGYLQQTAVDATGLKCYLLLTNGTKEAFYWVYAEYNAACEMVSPGTDDGGYIKCDANKAYMSLANNPSSAASYSFRFNGATTGIDEVNGEDGMVKTIYDLQGRKLSEIKEPGFYIVNGKKILVK